MEYTIKRLSNLAKISTRTLRYYDEIALLKPARINSSGYRIYGKEQVDKLQQILFFKELGLDLDSIKSIVNNPEFNKRNALKEHHKKLLARKKQLEKLIANVEKTIAESEGVLLMKDHEKFEGFKQKMLDNNESMYGKEARQKYGDEAVEKSNKRFKNMTEQEYTELEELGRHIKEVLKEAYATGDPASDLAQTAAELHRKWISRWWGYYDKNAHIGLAQMYVDDERFRKYYDQDQPGTAEFLREAINLYVKNLV